MFNMDNEHSLGVGINMVFICALLVGLIITMIFMPKRLTLLLSQP